MERKEFMRTLGAGAAFALTFPCLQGCSKDNDSEGNVPVPEGVDFTIDLTSSEGQKLMDNGSFIVKNLVVVARNLEGKFVAASQVCSHENYAEVQFIDQQGGIFYCDVHGSRFSQNGTPLNQVGNSPAKVLKIFNTELNENILRVFEA